jgi:hypothetical protein
MNPKYSMFKSAIRGVNIPHTIGLMISSAASSNRFACATGAGTICAICIGCAAAAAFNNCARTNVCSANAKCSPS